MTTFAFIHGAADVGWYWHLVEAELHARGHDSVAPDLPVEDDEIDSGHCPALSRPAELAALLDGCLLDALEIRQGARA
jgi:hypothetical protein